MSRLVAISFLLLTTIAFANAPPPPRPTASVVGEAQVPVTIERKKLDDGAQAILVLPKGLSVGGLRIADEPRPKSGSMGAVVAGLALSLAAVSAFFALRGRRTGKTVAIGMFVVAAALGTWSAAQADLSFPGGNRPKPPRPPRERPTLTIKVTNDDVDHATLILAE